MPCSADVAAGSDSALKWYENTDGAGSAFVRAQVDAIFQRAQFVHAVDVNRDGRVDLVVGHETANQAFWYDNTAGDGSSFLERQIFGLPSGGGAPFLAVLDMDADADNDLLTITPNGVVAWYENTGGVAGPCPWPVRNVTADARGGVEAIATDIDADGDPDIVATSRVTAQPGSADRLAWYRNRTIHRNAPFASGSDLTTDSGNATWEVTVGDVDGDGDPDLVAGTDGQPIRLYRNHGTSDPWSGVVGVDITSDARFTQSVVLGDVDGDGDLDLVAGNAGRNRLYLNNGTSDPWRAATGIDVTTDAHDRVPSCWATWTPTATSTSSPGTGISRTACTGTTGPRIHGPV